MPVHAVLDATLTITLDDGVATPVTESCQIITAEYTPAVPGEGTILPTACGDRVAEPGDPQAGSITGEVLKDARTAGFTRLLAAAAVAGTVFTYTYTENEGTVDELSWSGQARASAFAVPFAPAKNGRHALALTVITSELAPAFVAG